MQGQFPLELKGTTHLSFSSRNLFLLLSTKGTHISLLSTLESLPGCNLHCSQRMPTYPSHILDGGLGIDPFFAEF
uniref:Uncharacterized protein n=1 Tax=Rhizophora mucronata TaxID=61149 RepID=A0A2P2Q4P5_RHIMU